MKTYRVFARSIGYVYCDIEAENEEEAMEIYENTDGGCFTEYDGGWEFSSIEEMEAENETD